MTWLERAVWGAVCVYYGIVLFFAVLPVCLLLVAYKLATWVDDLWERSHT